jgi:alcohol dehydrogenase (cytochrome c)
VNADDQPKESRTFRCSVFALTAAAALGAAMTGGCTNKPASQTATTASPTGASEAAGPSSQTLLALAQDPQDWVLAGHGYDNNRFVSSTVTKGNVGGLGPAWSTQIADDGEQEAAPIVWHGTMYLSTPHNHVIALDAATGALKWDAPYTPATILDFAVNRGVGIADGKVFILTQDCRIRALDAQTGHQVWNVAGCSTAQNNWYSMPAYVYKDKLLVGVAGGDFGGNGSVQAFSTKDGTKLWQWDTVPGPGQPGHETWPGDSWKHGGAALWGGLSVDPQTNALYIAPGNAGPDFDTPKGKDLYSDSVVALDISGAQPKLKWYYQVLEQDTHDADPAMPPVLFDGKVDGKTRQLLAIADKAGNFAILDRSTGAVVHRLAVATQLNVNVAPSVTGEKTCPNHGGGAEWLGGAYDPTTNYFVIPVTQECGVFKRYETQPAWVQGQNYRGGPPVARQDASGLINAVDVSSGTFAWRSPVPYPAQGGALITSTGMTFTTDLGGNLYAFDTKTGAILWKHATGTAIVAPISSYSVDGQEYLAVEGGQPGNQRTPNLPSSKGSFIMAFRVGATNPLVNSTKGQSVVVAAAAAGAVQAGTAPYTPAQVQAGKSQYAASCAACHGARLQGVSGPALAGSAFGKSHLSISALRTVVTKQMPLTAPGSLTPGQYASIMAYVLAANCVKPSGNGTTPFPVTDRADFKTVVLVGAACAP